MIVNSTEIQFLTGCSRREAEFIIIDTLEITEKQGFRVKPSTSIESDDIKKKLLSVNECMDGKNPVQNAIDLIKEHGLSDSMKRGILNDIKCWHSRDLVSPYKILKRILPESEISNLKKILLKRCYTYMVSGGQFPKSFKSLSFKAIKNEFEASLKSQNIIA